MGPQFVTHTEQGSHLHLIRSTANSSVQYGYLRAAKSLACATGTESGVEISRHRYGLMTMCHEQCSHCAWHVMFHLLQLTDISGAQFQHVGDALTDRGGP
jgi:hypothetical protein